MNRDDVSEQNRSTLVDSYQLHVRPLQQGQVIYENEYIE